MTDQVRVIAVIPCYNEQKHLLPILTTLSGMGVLSVVVDDRSTDGTKQLSQRYANYAIRNTGPRGAGAATREGIQRAILLGADVIVTLDGDGQHNPADLPALVAPIIADQADCVIGSRFLDNVSRDLIPRYRQTGIRVITMIYNWGSQHHVSDAQCCYRAFRASVADRLCPADPTFGFSTEMLIRARRLGLRITEVPVQCIYHNNITDNSTLSPITHGISVALRTLRWRAWETLNAR